MSDPENMSLNHAAGSSHRKGDRQFRLLLTCIGRRVELVEAFRRAAASLGIRLVICGADINWLAPAMHHVDRAELLPPLSEPLYLSALLRLIEAQSIDLAIPLIDWELKFLAAHKADMAKLGCRALISSPESVAICRDKLKTFEFLVSNGIATPGTWLFEELIQLKSFSFPYFMKPRFGSASLGISKIDNELELRAIGAVVRDPIVQEFAPGVEHTLDVYAGLDGVVRCVVPRRRMEVRLGEVCKGLVVKDPDLIRIGKQVVEALPGVEGVITVQCIVAPDKTIRVIEVNPRFGGGAPLAIHAGADFPKWILMELMGQRPAIRLDGYRDRVAMLRYDQSVFLDMSAVGNTTRPPTIGYGAGGDEG